MHNFCLNSQIFKEIQAVNFVSTQAGENTDVSCRSKMSLIFRYAVEQNIVERFIGFFDVSKNETASGLVNFILLEINEWGVGNKIICQTYEGDRLCQGKKKWGTVPY